MRAGRSRTHFARAFRSRATSHLQGDVRLEEVGRADCPVCEPNGLAANGIIMLAKTEGNTMIDGAAPAKLKHFSAQVAMVAQSSMAFSHGSAFWGAAVE
jgi:hypothetical protein